MTKPKECVVTLVLQVTKKIDMICEDESGEHVLDTQKDQQAIKELTDEQVPLGSSSFCMLSISHALWFRWFPRLVNQEAIR